MRWPETCSKMLEQLFALAEAIEEDGERADVHGVRAQPDQVGLNAGQLIEQHPQILLRAGGISSCSSFSTARQ